MKAISGALSAALGAPVQLPAVLVEIAFSTTARWSSFSTLAWSSQTWTAKPIDITQLRVAPLALAGELVIDRFASAECAQVLSEGMQDRGIRIWGYDAGATATGDVVWLCDAVGGAATAEEDRVRISLRHRCAYMTAPRAFVRGDFGFNTLLPADRPLTINGITFTLDRRT